MGYRIESKPPILARKALCNPIFPVSCPNKVPFPGTPGTEIHKPSDLYFPGHALHFPALSMPPHPLCLGYHPQSSLGLSFQCTSASFLSLCMLHLCLSSATFFVPVSGIFPPQFLPLSLGFIIDHFNLQAWITCPVLHSQHPVVGWIMWECYTYLHSADWAFNLIRPSLCPSWVIQRWVFYTVILSKCLSRKSLQWLPRMRQCSNEEVKTRSQKEISTRYEGWKSLIGFKICGSRSF